jgi:hypothetical protein
MHAGLVAEPPPLSPASQPLLPIACNPIVTAAGVTGGAGLQQYCFNEVDVTS